MRPVREQLEHDRVIRLLQAKYKRKFEVAINPGNEQTMGVGPAPSQWYPDLVLQSPDRAHKLAGVVEVETTESVNNLEAMSQWAAFGRLRVPFHLYLPTASVDSARRYCAEMGIPVAELWAYQSIGDQLRFTLVHRTGESDDGKSRPDTEPAAEPRPRASSRQPSAAAAPTAPPSAGTTATPRARGNGQARRAATTRRPAAATPARRPAAAATRRPAAKAKAVGKRRPAAKAAPARRKTKAASSSRAQKRR